MDSLQLIRTLRHALGTLRDIRDPDEIRGVAQALIDELESQLRHDASPFASAVAGMPRGAIETGPAE